MYHLKMRIWPNFMPFLENMLTTTKTDLLFETFAGSIKDREIFISLGKTYF